jgi:hypothetical protein
LNPFRYPLIALGSRLIENHYLIGSSARHPKGSDKVKKALGIEDTLITAGGFQPAAR